jgi:phage gp46-like protein
MSDLALMRRSDGFWDLDFQNSDLVETESLENAVIISIGSYAREKSDAAAVTDPQFGGWFGDDTLDSPLASLGGYLYRLHHRVLDSDTCKECETLVTDALQWMIDDGVAASVSCSASIIDGENADKVLYFPITITKPSGDTETFKYELNWEATDGL